jgi:hypothetical protein
MYSTLPGLSKRRNVGESPGGAAKRKPGALIHNGGALPLKRVGAQPSFRIG